MTETTSHNQGGEQPRVDDAERLMTRIIDGEAEAAERRHFEGLAAENPTLWRKLAERQQDMLALEQDVEHELGEAFRMNIDLALANRAGGGTGSGRRERSFWWMGWAAAVVLAAVWLIVATLTPGGGQHDDMPTRPALGAGERLAPDEHLRRYIIGSPFVVGELDPIMLRHEEVADGVIELRILRRIEEVYLLDRDEPLPVDADGRLIRDPVELQQRSIGAADSQ